MTDHLEKLIVEFYSTDNSTRRSELHEILIRAQRTPEAWQCIWDFVNLGKLPTVQLFGVNCLLEKLSRNWEECCDSTGKVEKLREFVIERLESLNLLAVVRAKLITALAILAIQSMPDIWTDPLSDLSQRWGCIRLALFVHFLTELPKQQRSLVTVVDRRNLTRSVLLNSTRKISQIIQLSLKESEKVEVILAAINCTESWISLPGIDLHEWQINCLQCLYKVQDGRCRDTVASFLNRLTDVDELNSFPLFLQELFGFIATVLCPLLEEVASKDLANLADENLSIVKAMVGFVENFTSVFVKTLGSVNFQQADSLMVSYLQRIARFLTFLSAAPGYYPVDEELSDLPTNFWYNLSEDVTSMSAASAYSVEDQRKVKTAVEPLYQQLLKTILNKLQYPPRKVLDSWSVEDREAFESYRDTVNGAVLSCYYVLGQEYLLNAFITALKSESGSAEFIESAIFCLENVAEYVTSESKLCASLIGEIVAKVCTTTDVRLINTTLRCLNGLSHVITENDIRVIKAAILPHFDKAETVDVAVETLRCIARERPNELKLVADELFQVCYQCFSNDERSVRSRLLAVECVGLALSVQAEQVILGGLNSILAPRLVLIDEMCRAQGQRPRKKELLFELDVVSVLLGSLETPSNTGQTENKPPVYVVMEKSLPLFHQLVLASNFDPDLVSKICDCLRKGIGSLMDLAGPLLKDCLGLLVIMFPGSCAPLSAAKQLFLLFAADRLYTSNLTDFLYQCCEKVVPIVNGEFTDILEAFMGFCYNVAKKHWAMLELEENGKLSVAKLIVIACGVFEHIREAPAVKHSSLFLCEVMKRIEAPWLQLIVTNHCPNLIRLCMLRIQNDILTSSVEYVADFLRMISDQWPMETRHVLKSIINSPQQEQQLIAAMLAESKNKRKFREFAKRINMESRRRTR